MCRGLRLERVANPNGHFGFRGERQHVRVKNFCSAGRERVRFIVAQIVQKFCLRGLVRIRGVDAVHVGPDHEFVGIDDVSDDGAGKIRAVAAERGDAAVGSCADETGDDRNDAGLEQRRKNSAAAAACLLELRLGVAEGVAGEHEFRGSDGNRRDAGAFERGGEETRAEAFAERCETIEEFRQWPTT